MGDIDPNELVLIRGRFHWGKGGKVTAAGWQVTPCDPMVCDFPSRCDDLRLRTAIPVYSLTYRTYLLSTFRMLCSWTLIDMMATVNMNEGLRTRSISFLLFIEITPFCIKYARNIPSVLTFATKCPKTLFNFSANITAIQSH